MSPGDEFRILVFPANQILSINKASHVAREVTENYFHQCESVEKWPSVLPQCANSVNRDQEHVLDGFVCE